METKSQEWLALGDANPLEYFGEWVRKDSICETGYNIVRVTNLQDACGGEGYLFEECYIDLLDTWINKVDVKSYTGMEVENNCFSASDVVSYYGCVQCVGNELIVDTKEEVMQYLNEWGIML